jgi:polyferredoxin
MDKMQYPRGLVRYDTLNGMTQHLTRRQEWRRVFRPRVLVYTGILLVIVAAFLYSLLVLRSPYKVDVVRDRGVLARVVEDGHVENVYRLQLMNATERRLELSIGVQGLPGAVIDPAAGVTVEPTEARWVVVAVRVPPNEAEKAGPGSHEIRFTVEQRPDTAGAGPNRLVEKSTFIVPR